MIKRYIGMKINPQHVTELTELIEDTIEYYCDHNLISGEAAWIITECLAVAKQSELAGLLAAN